MTKLVNQLVTPHSILIEQTALKMAAEMYEIGRSQGLTSKYKDPRSYARAYVEKYIPLAVNVLIDILGNANVPAEQKELIYDAIAERTNDQGLSNSGLKAFENNTPFIPDWKPPSKLDLALNNALKDMNNGQKSN